MFSPKKSVSARFPPFLKRAPPKPHVQEQEVAIRNGIRVALLNFQVTPAVRAEAILLAQAGAASLLISPIMPDWDASPETWPARMVQAVSYGALIGADAAAADRRIEPLDAIHYVGASVIEPAS
ncbi:MAG: hypothetical protein U0R19_35650 [Bryobacteraceae bacterium]